MYYKKDEEYRDLQEIFEEIVELQNVFAVYHTTKGVKSNTANRRIITELLKLYKEYRKTTFYVDKVIRENNKDNNRWNTHKHKK